MGIDQLSKEAYIYSYGDLLAGDRDPLAEDAEYIRFTKEEGEDRRTLKIKAQVSIKAGSSGLTNLVEWQPVQEQLDAMGYITEALKGSTTISGGLILTSLISLLDQDGATKSGINGIYDASKLGGGIAAWYGGNMLDKFDYYYWDETDWTLKPKPDVDIPDNIAQGLDRMDGTGYRAGGNFWWDEDGNIYADPLSFFVGEETVGNVLALFRFNYKPDTIDKPFKDVLSVTPMRPFTELTISGAQNRLYFGDSAHYIELDENGDFHFSHGVYSDSFVSALGLNPNTGGGGGGSYDRLDAWADYTPERAGWVLSAALGYDLHSRVSSLEGGSALSFTTEGSGNVVTAVKKSGTAVIVTKGLTALTSHQPIYSLAFQTGAFVAKTYSPNTGTQTVNIPTKVSHLSNDSGFITAATANATFATKLGVSGNQIGTYVGGRLGNLITVPYATNADTVDGYHETSFFREERGAIQEADLDTFVSRASGIYRIILSSYSDSMAVFKSSPSSSALELRFRYSGELWARFSADSNRYSTGWKQLAFTDSNVASATKLQTARTLWGNTFNGEQNIGGDIVFDKSTDNRQLTISKGGSLKFNASTASWACGFLTYTNDGATQTGGIGTLGHGNDITYWYIGKSYDNPQLVVTPTGNVGIGTLTPAYKLDVNGATRINDNLYLASYGTTYLGKGTGDGATWATYNVKLHLHYGMAIADHTDNINLLIDARLGNFSAKGTVYATKGIWSDGYVSAKGQNTASDARLKRRMEDVALTVKDVAEAPVYRFAWINGGGIDVGSTAQYWAARVPELTHSLPDGIHLGLDYGKAALLSVVAVARATADHERRIADIERQLQIQNDMKRFIKWLADVFNVELTREVIKEVEKIEYRYLPANGKITGDIVIEGDVRVEGNMEVYGGLSATGNISAMGVYGSVTAKCE